MFNSIKMEYSRKNIIILLNPLLSEIIYAIKIYFFWTFIHNLSIYLYNRFCVYNNWITLFLTPLYVNTPHCRALFYVFSTSTDMMNKMLICLSLWFIPKFASIKLNVKN